MLIPTATGEQPSLNENSQENGEGNGEGYSNNPAK
jgi:hypothetical protein